MGDAAEDAERRADRELEEEGRPRSGARPTEGRHVASNINVVVIVGNLTRDPELKHLPSGTALCEMGVAVNSRRKDQSGEWVDKPNFFDVTVFGNQAESCAQYLAKGRPVAVHGRLDWQSWETDGGQKRSKVVIIADSVQFLHARGDSEGGSGSGQSQSGASDFGGSSDFDTAPTDDDIPF